jgi:uncharacterized protein (DUF433 family)
METTIEKRHIERREGVCGGRPCVVETRIRVIDIYVWHELRGKRPEEIVAEFPQLTVADVHAALAYYFDHREEIQADMQATEEYVARMKATQGPGLIDRLRAAAQGVPTTSDVRPVSS